MKRTILSILALLTVIFSTSCSGTEETEPSKSAKSTEEIELSISAASSLTEALEEIKKAYVKENPNASISFNFGSSGKLSQQIEQGAPVDVFLTADKKWVDTLAEKKLIEKDSITDFATNKLVVIADKKNTISLSSLEDLKGKDVGQIAVGEPESVPAGSYTKEALEALNIWNELQDELVYTNNVRQIVTYVETGNVELGFVYYSDTMILKNSKIAGEVNSDLHSPIVYSGGAVTSSKNLESAKSFIQFLSTDTAQDILKQYGFNH